jgi:hypothetical protein
MDPYQDRRDLINYIKTHPVYKTLGRLSTLSVELIETDLEGMTEEEEMFLRNVKWGMDHSFPFTTNSTCSR